MAKEYFFEKELVVLGEAQQEEKVAPKADIDLQFFPEGGYLVDQVASRVAFRAIDQNGKAVDVKGIIYDEQDQEVARFESVHQGMGVVAFSPQKGKSYRAEIEHGSFPFFIAGGKNPGASPSLLTTT